MVVAIVPWNAEGQLLPVISSPFSCFTEPAAGEFVVLLEAKLLEEAPCWFPAAQPL